MMQEYLIVGYPYIHGIDPEVSEMKCSDDREALDKFDTDVKFNPKWKNMNFIFLYKQMAGKK